MTGHTYGSGKKVQYYYYNSSNTRDYNVSIINDLLFALMGVCELEHWKSKVRGRVYVYCKNYVNGTRKG